MMCNQCLLLFPSRFQAISSLRAYEKNKKKKFIFELILTIFEKWKGCDLKERRMIPKDGTIQERAKRRFQIQVFSDIKRNATDTPEYSQTESPFQSMLKILDAKVKSFFV